MYTLLVPVAVVLIDFPEPRTGMCWRSYSLSEGGCRTSSLLWLSGGCNLFKTTPKTIQTTPARLSSEPGFRQLLSGTGLPPPGRWVCAALA
jgi:hypothetical protein